MCLVLLILRSWQGYLFLLGLCKWSFRTQVHSEKNLHYNFLNYFQEFKNHSRIQQSLFFPPALFLQHLNKISVI